MERNIRNIRQIGYRTHTTCWIGTLDKDGQANLRNWRNTIDRMDKTIEGIGETLLTGWTGQLKELEKHYRQDGQDN